jgi:hypothetical protein
LWARGRFVAKTVKRVLAKELREQAYFEKQPSPGDQRSFIPFHFLDHWGDTAPCRANVAINPGNDKSASSPNSSTTIMAARRTAPSSRR